MRSFVRSVVFAIALGGCWPSYADGYLEALSSGIRAQSGGRLEEAEQAFARAAELGDRDKDRDEARMLQAEALEKLGRPAEAEAAYRRVELDSNGGYHGARAAFALGRLVLARDGFEAGSRETLRAVRAHPTSGLARHAVRRLIAIVEDRDGPASALTWLEPIRAELETTDVAEALAYERARLLAKAGQRAQAAAELLATARAHPYPRGSLTDDAFFVASLLLEELGRPKEAIDVLEEMLAPREEAMFGSSYERPRFPQAAYRIAVLWRDALGDGEKARAAFERVATVHKVSRYADDALWQKARIERNAGESQAACATLNSLRHAFAESRFVRCAPLLCASAPASERPCSNYIEEGLARPPGDDPFGRDPSPSRIDEELTRAADSDRAAVTPTLGER